MQDASPPPAACRVAAVEIMAIETGADGRRVVAARADRGAEGVCPLPPAADPTAVARFGREAVGRPAHAAVPEGALRRWLALPSPAERAAYGAVRAALGALREALGALREAVTGEALPGGGGPVAPPALLEMIDTAGPEADPLAACRDPARTLLVVDATGAGGPEGLRDLAALARAFDVRLALRPLSEDPAEAGRAARLAAAVGAAVTRPPPPPTPAMVRGGGGGGSLAVREVVLHRVSLPLRDLYVSAMYLTDRQARTVVEIRTQGGTVGWGETHGAVAPLVARLAEAWIGRDLARERAALRRRFARIGFDNRDGRNGLAAFAGLDLAAWDAAARAAGLSLRAALGDAGEGGAVEIACPLPAAAPGRMVTREELATHMADTGNAARVAGLAAGIAARWGVRAFKYKSAGPREQGGGGAAWDLAALTALRHTLGPEARLRFDPNAAYGTEEARRLCLALEPLGLEFHEDPTDGLEGMARLAAYLRTPLATNMCITAPEHLAAAARRAESAPDRSAEGARDRNAGASPDGHPPGVSVVLGDLFYWGGVAGLRDMAAVARLLGMTPALHSFYETGLATAANAQIALALGLDRPHPMDCGWPLLAADIVGPGAFATAGGRLAAPQGPGLGLAPDPDRLAALRIGEPVVIR